jgi:uncharacterized membrane protein
MKTKVSFQMSLRIIIVASLIISALLVYQSLPQTIPVHWNINGVADGFGDKLYGVALIPAISLIFLVLFPLLSRLDPKKENYELFKESWDWLQSIIIIFLGYVFAVQLYFTVNPQTDAIRFGQLLMGGMGVMFILLGNVMGKIRQNYFVGLRTPWTLSDPEVWEKSQHFAGWCFVIAGIAFLIAAIIGYFAIWLLFAVILAAAVVPTVYSYWLYKKTKKA